jgi:putative membrane protein
MTDNMTTDPRVLFAAERTFLAWIRTGLALMGFGFVVARFGIFLQQLVLDRGYAPVQSSGISVVSGVALLATGVAVCLAATWRHIVLIRALKRGEALAVRPSALAIALALVLAVVGLLMTFYVLHARSVIAPSSQKGQTTQVQNDFGDHNVHARGA